MFVKPAEGRTVRRPDTLVHLAREGEHVPDGDEFWVRRLIDEDVVEADAPDAEAEERPRGDVYEIGKSAKVEAEEPEAVAEESRP